MIRQTEFLTPEQFQLTVENCALVHKALGVLQVVQQSPRSRHQQIDTLDQPLGFASTICTTHQQAVCLRHKLHESACCVIGLHGQLAGG